ncbi:MAG: PEP-CTERM sorting domain-containing protein, partial [Thermodesulfobacteriota bacterium]
MKHMIPKVLSIALFFFILSIASPGNALLIDFETVPGDTPSDQLAITNQYESLYGVTFSLSNGLTPHLEQSGGGDPGNGFSNNLNGGQDVARTGYTGPSLGSYFLRLGTSSFYSVPVPELIISYTNPVSGASAQIWDIDVWSDGYEQWLVKAWDAGDNLLDSTLSPVGLWYNQPASLDGLPWTWSFDRGGAADIYKISIEFVGTRTSGIGLAFDNFNTNTPAVPEPSTLLLLGSGLAGLG